MIDVSIFEDRWSMCRPSKIDGRCEIRLLYLLKTLILYISCMPITPRVCTSVLSFRSANIFCKVHIFIWCIIILFQNYGILSSLCYSSTTKCRDFCMYLQEMTAHLVMIDTFPSIDALLSTTKITIYTHLSAFNIITP